MLRRVACAWQIITRQWHGRRCTACCHRPDPASSSGARLTEGDRISRLAPDFDRFLDLYQQTLIFSSTGPGFVFIVGLGVKPMARDRVDATVTCGAPARARGQRLHGVVREPTACRARRSGTTRRSGTATQCGINSSKLATRWVAIFVRCARCRPACWRLIQSPGPV